MPKGRQIGRVHGSADKLSFSQASKSASDGVECVLEIDGILLDKKSYELIRQIRNRLEQEGDCPVYGVCKSRAGRGQIRFAHQGRDAKRKKAKGVFCTFVSTARGVVYTPHQEGDRSVRIPLTAENFDSILGRIRERRDLVKEKKTSSEKVYPQAGMVSAGQFESNRRKH